MNDIDVINMYYNMIFNYSTVSFYRTYEDYESISSLSAFCKAFDIDLGFIHQVDEENISMFRRSKSLKQADYLFKTNYEDEHHRYLKQEKQKYQVLFLPGFDGDISKHFIQRDYVLSFLQPQVRIFHLRNLLNEEDLSIYGPYSLFLNALFQIDHWPGIFVFKDNQWCFVPITSLDEVKQVFKDIENNMIFQRHDVIYDDYFVQLSDLHLGTKKSDEGLHVLNENLDKMMNYLYSHRPIQFLITGDLMNSPNRKNMYQASRFMNHLKRQYRGEVTFVLGNHDVIVHGLNLLKRQKAKVVAYLLGEYIKVLEDQKMIIIKIDSTSEGNLARGKVGINKLEEIEEELSLIDHLEDYTLVAMMHHHLIPIEKAAFLKTKWNEKLFFGKIVESSKALVDASDVIEWLDRFGVRYVFHGHKHIPHVSIINDTYVIAGGSSCGGGAKESKSRYLSYNILKYNRLNHEFKYCFIFYDDLTKQERRRIKIHILRGSL